MAIRKNPDGSVTVGVIPSGEEEQPKPEKAEVKKPTKKAKK